MTVVQSLEVSLHFAVKNVVVRFGMKVTQFTRRWARVSTGR